MYFLKSLFDIPSMPGMASTPRMPKLDIPDVSPYLVVAMGVVTVCLLIKQCRRPKPPQHIEQAAEPVVARRGNRRGARC